MLEFIVIVGILVGFFFLTKWIKNRKKTDSTDSIGATGGNIGPIDPVDTPKRPRDRKKE